MRWGGTKSVQKLQYFALDWADAGQTQVTPYGKGSQRAEQRHSCSNSQRGLESGVEAGCRSQVPVGSKDGGGYRDPECTVEALQCAVRHAALPISGGATAISTAVGVAAIAIAMRMPL